MQLPPRYRWARAGAAGAYSVQGMCFAALLTQVPALQERYAFTNNQLTLVLLAVPLVAGVGTVLAGALAARLGSAVVLRVAGPGVCACLAAVGYAGTRGLLYPAVAGFGLFVGAVDATMNMQGVAVQRRYGRSILASFHGWWSLSGIVGSLYTAAVNRAGLALGPALGIAGLAGLAVALVAGPAMLGRAEERGDRSAAGTRRAVPDPPPAAAPRSGLVSVPVPAPRVPWRPIILVGLGVMAMYIAESSTSNWSAVYLHSGLRASTSVAALGLGAYLTCQVLGRALADRAVQRFGASWTVAAGGLIGALGLVAVVAAPVPAAGIAGFAVVGLGLCVVVPQAFSAAGALDPTGSGIAIARVNLFNYAGFIAGAALIGPVADLAGLRAAFAVPAALSLAIVALAPAFRTARPVTVSVVAPATG